MRIRNLKRIAINNFKGLDIRSNIGSADPESCRDLTNCISEDGKLTLFGDGAWYSYYTNTYSNQGDLLKISYLFNPEKYNPKLLMLFTNDNGGSLSELIFSSYSLNRIPLVKNVKDANKIFDGNDQSDSYYNYLKSEEYNILRIRDKLYIFNLNESFEARYIGRHKSTLNIPAGFGVIPSSLDDTGRISAKVSQTAGTGLNKFLGTGTWLVYYKIVLNYDEFQKGSGVNLGAVTIDATHDAHIAIDIDVSSIPPNVSSIFVYRGYIPDSSNVASQDQIDHRMIYELPLTASDPTTGFNYRSAAIKSLAVANFGYYSADYSSNGILSSEQADVMGQRYDVIGLKSNTTDGGSFYDIIDGEQAVNVYRKIGHGGSPTAYYSTIYVKDTVDRIAKRVRTFSTDETNKLGTYKKYVKSSSTGGSSPTQTPIRVDVASDITLSKDSYKIYIHRKDDDVTLPLADAQEYAKAFNNADIVFVKLYRKRKDGNGNTTDIISIKEGAYSISSVSGSASSSGGFTDIYIDIYLNKITSVDFQNFIDQMKDSASAQSAIAMNGSGDYTIEVSSLISSSTGTATYVTLDAQIDFDFSGATYNKAAITVDGTKTGGTVTKFNCGQDGSYADVDELDPSKVILYDALGTGSYAVWSTFTSNNGNVESVEYSFDTIAPAEGLSSGSLKLSLIDTGYENITGEIYRDIYTNMNFKYATVSEDRMIVANLKKDDELYPDAIAISEPGAYQRFVTVYNASWGDSDEITGIAASGEMIYVFKRTKIILYRLFKSNGELQFIKSYDGYGTKYHNTIQVIDGHIYFGNDTTFYRIVNGRIEDIGYPIRSIGTDTIRSKDPVTSDLMPEYDYSIYDKNNKMYCVYSFYYDPTSTNYAVSFTLLRFDILRNRWTKFHFDTTSDKINSIGRPYIDNDSNIILPINQYNGSNLRMGLYSPEITNDIIYRWPSPSEYISSELFYTGDTKMEWRRIYIDCSYTSSVTVTVYTETETKIYTLPSSGWIPIRMRGHYIKVKIQNFDTLNKVEAYGRPLRTK